MTSTPAAPGLSTFGDHQGARSSRLPLVLGVGALVVVAAGSAIAWFAYGQTTAGNGPRNASMLTADLATVRRESFDITTIASGELEAKNQIEVRSKVETQTTVAEIIEEGKVVKKGDLLIRLNADKIEQQVNDESLAVQTARAEYTTAESTLAIQKSENESKIRQAKLKVDLAQLALEQWEKGEVEQKRQELKLALEKGERDLNRLIEKAEKSKQLYEKNFLSKDEYQRDDIARVEAKAAYEKAILLQRIYEEYQYPKDHKTKQSDLDEATAELSRVKQTAEKELASKEAAVAKTKEALSLREAKLTKAKEQFAHSTINAPADGLVVYGTSLERNRWGFGGEGPLQIGREVYPNMLLMALPDTSEMVASVKVPESIAGRIKPGLQASVKVDAAGGRSFGGTVLSVGVLAESGGWRDPNLREYTVKISLDDIPSDTKLKPSMLCEAKIFIGRVDETVTVPVQAVFSDGAVRFAYLRSGQRYERRPVKMGRRSETVAEISAGIAEGDVILLREPAPGEIISRPWDTEELKLAGYEIADNGLPVAIGGSNGGRPPGAGPKSAGAKGRPDGAQKGAAPTAHATPAAGDAKAADSKPAEAPATTTAGDTTPAAEAPAPTTTGESKPAETVHTPAETEKKK